MRPHEKLEVWKRSVDLSVEIFNLTKGFPEEEKFGLVSQMRRASYSIASNIAEGAARNTDKQFIHYLSVAQGSSSEVETQLLIARRVDLITEDQYRQLVGEIGKTSRMMIGLSKFLRKRNKS